MHIINKTAKHRVETRGEQRRGDRRGARAGSSVSAMALGLLVLCSAGCSSEGLAGDNSQSAAISMVSLSAAARLPATASAASVAVNAPQSAGLLRQAAIEQARVMPVLEPSTQAFGLAQASVPGASWTELGPKPLTGTPWGNVSGRVTSLAVDTVKDPTGNTVYVATAYGGLWRTSNALSASPTYTPLTDSAQNMAIGAVALDATTTPTTIYLGTGEADNGFQVVYGGVGVLKSVDGGVTWTAVTTADAGAHSLAGLAFSRILVDPTNPAVLVAATTNSAYLNAISETYFPGIYRSSDHGATWTTVLNISNGNTGSGASVSDLAYDATRGAMFAAVYGTGIYKSNDHGLTWSLLPTPFAGAVSPSPSNFSYVKLANRGGTEYAAIVGVEALSTPTLGVDTGLVQSTDGGNTWTPIAIPDISGGESQLAFDLAMTAPPNSNSLVVGGVYDFATNAVNGKSTSWSQLNGSIHPDNHALVSISATRWFIGNDGGLYTTGDAGATVSDLNTNLATIQFYSATPDNAHPGTFLAGAQDNGVSKTTGGGNWSFIESGDGGYTAVNPLVSNQYFFEYQGVDLERSDDGGNSFTQILDVNGPHNLSVPAAPTTETVLPAKFGGHRRRHHRHHDHQPDAGADDGGADSGEVDDGFVKPFALVPPNYAQALYAIDAVWRGPTNPTSINAGWTAISPGWGGNIVDVEIDPTNPSNIYAINDSGQLWKTTNGSATTPTWTNVIASSFPGQPTAVGIVPGNTSTLYVTTLGYGHPNVYRTINGGTTWTSISGNLPSVPVNTIIVDPTTPSNLYIGTDIGVFVATDGGSGGASEVWSRYGSGLPNVAVFQLKLSTGTTPLLVAATFGRGAWSVPAIVTATATKIDAGGAAVAPFIADTDFNGGTTINHVNTIDLSGVSNPAPMAVYQSARTGNFSYTIPGFVPSSSHTVRLHFAETYFATTGSRVFNASINGVEVLTNFDIYKMAGAKNKALIEQFTQNANATGAYVVQFTSVVNNSLVSGIEAQ